MHVAAIIQARMTSTRFPGKVLKPLAGKPVIWRIIYRLLTFKTLERLHLEVGDDPVAKEHVTGYFDKNPNFATSTSVTPEPSCQFAGARMSVDTPADLKFMEELYRLSGAEPGEFDIRSAVELLRCNPELLKINSHIYQKNISDTTRQVLFRCDADERIGFGHLFRCIALAEELREQHGCGITFALASGKPAKEILNKEGFRVIDIKTNDETAELDRVITELQPSALVFDSLTPIEPDAIAKWRRKGLITATIDDPTSKRLSVDLAFYPPVPQVKELNWAGFTGELYSGWEWVVLRRQFAALAKEPKNKNQATHIIITMGGSDSLNMTGFALEALREVKTNCPLNVDILIGAAFNNKEELYKTLENYPHHYRIYQNITEPASLFRRADLAIASFGVTAYELAACGTPAALLCLTEDHSISASAFDEAGIAINLGIYNNLKTHTLAQAIHDMASLPTQIVAVSEKAIRLIDGNGALRVCHEIVSRLV